MYIVVTTRIKLFYMSIHEDLHASTTLMVECISFHLSRNASMWDYYYQSPLGCNQNKNAAYVVSLM